jgi:hypothetical protein
MTHTRERRWIFYALLSVRLIAVFEIRFKFYSSLFRQFGILYSREKSKLSYVRTYNGVHVDAYLSIINFLRMKVILVVVDKKKEKETVSKIQYSTIMDLHCFNLWSDYLFLIFSSFILNESFSVIPYIYFWSSST